MVLSFNIHKFFSILLISHFFWLSLIFLTSFKREKSYPALGEQFDLLYHAIDANEFGADAKTSSFYTKLKAVKDKYPKS